ncbi:alpha/beta hydrolase [Altererythrobacter sp. ZODW24]|uniref:alpha/beta fold hydrolase n=1 Tax=Altererythrobacter sp. ZODW24 TaxID=2185142 RepID=UPI000DF7C08A|nr:alpha/beta hydrolase [Altererythrobacter sp. ZODW24]
MSKVQFHEMNDSRRIAFRHLAGDGPALVFLPGYMSDMAGSKATATMEWAAANSRECLLLDYSGCGTSSGEFGDGALSKWREEILALLEARGIDRVTLIGSSMGGWLMLLVAETLGTRMAGMIGIASAPDFTDWGFTEEQKATLAAGKTVFEDNPYGSEPTSTHAKFWADGEAQKMLDREIMINCPVRLLHGQSDDDVPWGTSLRLAEKLRSPDVQVTLVKDGDHRLSREEDIALLLRTIANLPKE